MSTNIPLHETQEIYGVSEDCKFNDHPMCRSTRCGCSCHRQAKVAADNSGVNRVAAIPSTSIQTGLDKYCPVCKVKAATEQNYCTVDGAKLSSLRCPECGTPGEQSHIYCGYCGCSMKVTDQQMEAAATGGQIDKVANDPPVDIISDEDAIRVMREAMANKIKEPDVVERVPATTKPVKTVDPRLFK